MNSKQEWELGEVTFNYQGSNAEIGYSIAEEKRLLEEGWEPFAVIKDGLSTIKHFKRLKK
jgi:hypothetical protein